MKKIIFLFAFLMPILSNAQDKIYDIEDKDVQIPSYNYKENASFIAGNLKYPKEALKKGIQGTIYVEFVVEKDGSINKDFVKVATPVDAELDAEAIRVVKLSPNWKPATKNGEPVRYHQRLPIKFKIAK